MCRFTIEKKVLLTGAGFTHCFGGYLGQRMRIEIFNSDAIKEHDARVDREENRLAVRVLEDGANYESLYVDIVQGEAPATMKAAMIGAYETAYQRLDQAIFSHPLENVSYNRLSDFLMCFSGPDNNTSRGHIFTLNQDMFIERFYLNNSLTVPGVRLTPDNASAVPIHWGGGAGRRRELTPDDNRLVPTPEQMDEVRSTDQRPLSSSGRFQYIKLHGSMNWRTQEGGDVMVIAGDKLDQIREQPLLEWYWEKFRSVLRAGDVHLLIIGYGFGDWHINKAIADAMKQTTGLRWSIVYPKSLDDLRTRIEAGCRESYKSAYPREADEARDQRATRKAKLLLTGLDQPFPHDLSNCFPVGGAARTECEGDLLREFGPS